MNDEHELGKLRDLMGWYEAALEERLPDGERTSISKVLAALDARVQRLEKRLATARAGG